MAKFSRKSKSSDNDGPVKLYGYHAVKAALENTQRKFISLHLTKNMLDRLIEEGVDFPIEPKMENPRQINQLVGEDAVHQGAVLVCHPLEQPTLEEVRHHDLIIILDQVTDPHNVGAIHRSACALGAGALMTTRRNAPPESGLLAKTASGAFEYLPYIQVTNLARSIEECQALGFTTIGLDSEGPKDLVETLTGSHIDKVALILGAEGRGLRRLTRDLCDHLARLDMPGPIKSLNVSNASALALFVCQQALSAAK
ncbi:MAG: 23S rRNA (guanosine(2251)-2'-O)-methyltransferase RlmB [Hyphomicrobiales bacterium]|nr:MAG: 23S rRNA (guanosine(2251)-2'-O)-methyltransferase RlmB [Hyphomicrobiales bacterium]